MADVIRELSKAGEVHGPWVILIAILLAAIGFLYLRLEKLQTEYRRVVAALKNKHMEAVSTLQREMMDREVETLKTTLERESASELQARQMMDTCEAVTDLAKGVLEEKNRGS